MGEKSVDKYVPLYDDKGKLIGEMVLPAEGEGDVAGLIVNKPSLEIKTPEPPKVGKN
jgi:hypothetical protein